MNAAVCVSSLMLVFSHLASCETITHLRATLYDPNAAHQKLVEHRRTLNRGVTVSPAQLRNGQQTHPPHWGYKEVIDEIPPLKWETAYPACNGTRQSPIHIITRTSKVEHSLKPIQFTNYRSQPIKNMWTVLNNGHVVQLSANFTPAHTPELYGGTLGAKYVFSQLHFHWGSNDSRGSEHRLNGKSFPLELHIVHRKATDENGTEMEDSTGLAVVSVLFTIAGPRDPPNIHLDAVAKAVAQEVQPLKPTTLRMPQFHLADLIPDSDEYYRYMGSLTTPPCAESVIWSVMRKPLHITEKQLKAFRSLHAVPGERHDIEDPENLVDNYRPIQRLNGRVVKLFTRSRINMRN